MRTLRALSKIGQPPGGAQGGSDVITRTATKRINWASYKINQATDRIGVFVSVVSTKVPYKGAGKEYICARSLCGLALKQCLPCIQSAVRRFQSSCCWSCIPSRASMTTTVLQQPLAALIKVACMPAPACHV
jgi:hypothetical protein